MSFVSEVNDNLKDTLVIIEDDIIKSLSSQWRN